MKQIKKQKGVVLAISLIMLVLITILAVSAMRTTIMEERMASNSRNNNLAFQRAETSLRAAEAALFDAGVNNGAGNTPKSKANGLSRTIGIANCVVDANSVNFLDDATWANACTYNGGGLDANKHKYFIEFLFAKSSISGAPTAPCYYRVTARGYGEAANSHSTLQTTFGFEKCAI